jgi:protoporphyrinogen oxidase
LYRIFFKTYTEKVWGISTRDLNSTWAAQRIKNLSLFAAIKDAFGFKSKTVITTLIDTFKYPQHGPGQLWESVTNKLVKDGVPLSLESVINSVKFDGQGYVLNRSNGGSYFANAVFCSMPLSVIPKLLNAPDEIIKAAEKLRYRDFLIVAVPVIASKVLFNDNWIYIHDPAVRVSRIQNYLSWSPDLVAPGTSCLGLEYFVNKDDEIWASSDAELISYAKAELKTLDLKCDFIDDEGYVVRVEKAYPVYDENYQKSVSSISAWRTANLPKWYQLGRNGQHHYNNQDHSMLTAIYAVDNFIGSSKEDYWNVNLGDEYHEEIKHSREAPIISS